MRVSNGPAVFAFTLLRKSGGIALNGGDRERQVGSSYPPPAQSS